MIIRNILAGLLLVQGVFTISAQQASSGLLPSIPDNQPPPWSFSASIYHYILPGEINTTTVLGYADHKKVHLEARYNYEDVKTASVFGGYRIETGRKLFLSIIPMVGFAVGNTDGIIPGLEAALEWKKFDFYSESEYVINFAGGENNFFYTWTELAIAPIKNLRAGISGNRTRLFQSDLDIQKGVFAQYSFWKLTTGVHYFNPFSNDSFVIATLDIDF